MPTFSIHHGDCLDMLKALPDNSVDSVVTDPPYGLTNNGGGPSAKGQDGPHGRAKAGAARGGFMGLKWDSDVPPVEVWAECLRVLKPGGHLLAFAGTRTQHRMATRIEDAGFEIRDMIAWVYGSGFPKSHNGPWGGTALKPAIEPITVARKPLVGTVAANVLEHGTGALNIDGCRVEHVTVDGGSLATNPHLREQINGGNGGNIIAHEDERRVVTPHAAGRWPANLIHDGSDEVLAAFPDAKGQQGPISAAAPSEKTGNVYGRMKREGETSASSDNKGAVGFSMKPGMRRLDAGSAARFFYCAKASRKDRNEGLTDPGPQFKKGSTLRDAEKLNAAGDRKGNTHPTVKPTELMRYLVRLVTPPGGTVLDPFTGSGSTGKACMLEGFNFIGAEMDAGHVEVARTRCAHAQEKAAGPEVVAPRSSDPAIKATGAMKEQQMSETLPLFYSEVTA